jgi:hypothetical protein
MPKFASIGGLAIACIGFALQSGPANAGVSFIGKLIFMATNGTCDLSQGTPVGQRDKVQFIPARVAYGGPDSSISLFHDWGAENFLLKRASFDTTLRPVTHSGIADLPYSTSGVSILFVTQDPPVISGSTVFLTVTGIIRGWQGGPKCNVSFRMSLARG